MRLSFSFILTVFVVCAEIEFPVDNAESNLITAADPNPELLADGLACSDSALQNLRVRPRDGCDKYKPKAPTANDDHNNNEKPGVPGDGESNNDQPDETAAESPISWANFYEQFETCVYLAWIVCGLWEATDLLSNGEMYMENGLDLVDAEECKCSLYYSWLKIALKHLIR